MWALPWPWMPATPTRIVSLAPSTRPDDLVPAIVNDAAPARVPLRNLRRVGCLMGTSPEAGEETGEVVYRAAGIRSCRININILLIELISRMSLDLAVRESS